ncbi:MAG: hypothetical protein ACR2NS_01275 [Gemmatimonadaceae bacterium]
MKTRRAALWSSGTLASIARLIESRRGTFGHRVQHPVQLGQLPSKRVGAVVNGETSGATSAVLAVLQCYHLILVVLIHRKRAPRGNPPVHLAAAVDQSPCLDTVVVDEEDSGKIISPRRKTPGDPQTHAAGTIDDVDARHGQLVQAKCLI